MKTQAQAKNYILSHVNVGVDWDGYYGFQCMDLAVDYLYSMTNGSIIMRGNAVDSINNYFGKYATIYRNTPDFVPQLGDLAVWTTGSYSAYGHISIVYSATMQSFVSLDQNWNAIGSMGNPAHFVTHNYSNVTHFIRPNFSGSNENNDNSSESLNESVSDTKLNPDSKVSDWLKTKSGITFRYENGQFTVTKSDGVAVYGEPNNEGKLKTVLEKNTKVIYDYKYVNDGYVWISYEKGGDRYYAQAGFSDGKIGFKPNSTVFGSFKTLNIGELSYSDTVFDSSVKTGEWRKTKSGVTMRTENGKFEVTKDGGVAIYSYPNNDGKQFGTLPKGRYVIYDYKYINDGYVWVGFEKNGDRLYAQVGFSDGAYNYKEGTQPFGKFY